MEISDFERDFEWHDAVITEINIDRRNPGKIDPISFAIEWPDHTKSKIVFNGVYLVKMNLNFGVIAKENVLLAFVSVDDPDLIDLYKSWRGILDNIDLHCYIIETSSTGGTIKIIAKGFSQLVSE